MQRIEWKIVAAKQRGENNPFTAVKKKRRAASSVRATNETRLEQTELRFETGAVCAFLFGGHCRGYYGRTTQYNVHHNRLFI